MEQTHVEDMTPQDTTPIGAPEKIPNKPERHPVSPQLYQLRKYFVYVLVGGLIISALVAIIAVLVGNMSDLIGKTIATVMIIIVHSLVALGFISITSTKQPSRGSSIVVDTLFGITVLSLITAMLGTWEVVTDAAFILHQYMVFFVAFLTSLVIYGLFQATENDKPTVISRNTAIGSSLVSFGLLLPIIYEVGTLHELYYRILTAVNIVVGVSIVITVIFHWYYVSKHPELRAGGKAGEPMSVGKMIMRGTLILIGIWLLMAFLAGLYNGISSTYQSPSPRHTPAPSRYY